MQQRSVKLMQIIDSKRCTISKGLAESEEWCRDVGPWGHKEQGSKHLDDDEASDQKIDRKPNLNLDGDRSETEVQIPLVQSLAYDRPPTTSVD